ncbi:MAG: ornithine aminotransferase [Myxococcaceae bacterium]|nr:ornithine aminotransferase [Myxococcaceae bacterium]
MTKHANISDSDLQQTVIEELRRDSNLKGSRVGVSVNDQVVTLTGTVESFEERVAAQEAAHRSKGVLDVANDVRVGASTRCGRTDSEIARSVREALQCGVPEQAEHVRSTVTHGWVLLEGDVRSDAERGAAEETVRNLLGVCGVNNELRVLPILCA